MRCSVNICRVSSEHMVEMPLPLSLSLKCNSIMLHVCSYGHAHAPAHQQHFRSLSTTQPAASPVRYSMNGSIRSTPTVQIVRVC